MANNEFRPTKVVLHNVKREYDEKFLVNVFAHCDLHVVQIYVYQPLKELHPDIKGCTWALVDFVSPRDAEFVHRHMNCCPPFNFEVETYESWMESRKTRLFESRLYGLDLVQMASTEMDRGNDMMRAEFRQVYGQHTAICEARALRKEKFGDQLTTEHLADLESEVAVSDAVKYFQKLQLVAEEDKCSRCGHGSVYLCKSCLTPYCSEACQQLDWPFHHHQCQKNPSPMPKMLKRVLKPEPVWIYKPKGLAHILYCKKKEQQVEMAMLKNKHKMLSQEQDILVKDLESADFPTRQFPHQVHMLEQLQQQKASLKPYPEKINLVQLARTNYEPGNYVGTLVSADDTSKPLKKTQRPVCPQQNVVDRSLSTNRGQGSTNNSEYELRGRNIGQERCDGRWNQRGDRQFQINPQSRFSQQEDEYLPKQQANVSCSNNGRFNHEQRQSHTEANGQQRVDQSNLQAGGRQQMWFRSDMEHEVDRSYSRKTRQPPKRRIRYLEQDTEKRIEFYRQLQAELALRMETSRDKARPPALPKSMQHNNYDQSEDKYRLPALPKSMQDSNSQSEDKYRLPALPRAVDTTSSELNNEVGWLVDMTESQNEKRDEHFTIESVPLMSLGRAGTKFRALIQWIQNDNSIFLIDINSPAFLKTPLLSSLIKQQVETSAPISTNLMFGDLVLAPFQDAYYRAAIIKEAEEDLVKVMFVDFGNPASIPLAKLRPVTDQITKFPSACNCVKVSAVFDGNGQVIPDKSHTMRQFLKLDQTLEGVVDTAETQDSLAMVSFPELTKNSEMNRKVRKCSFPATSGGNV